ncbi:DUF488 domain-containing protein [Schlesneria paludicola]|uniref:DUF488 domain-containing protein n=1 Tax=Schlesneria paludicola TaxID=360056 RepID=UPI00029A763D|nr:DUF488 family protein [Schlesneria paludicola]
MKAKHSSDGRTIRLVRAYDITESDAGYRVLVDRIWPRGVTKERLALDAWPKELAPSAELRNWFQHDPVRWGQFRTRYFRELKANADRLTEMLAESKGRPLLLIYGARDVEHNNAVALRDFLNESAELTS